LGAACVPECPCRCEPEVGAADGAMGTGRLNIPNDPWTGEARS
jgi:hypothetical protein